MEEDNTFEIAKQIFSKPPGPRKSIYLWTEDECPNFKEIVISITLHGIFILYGHYNYLSLNNEQIEYLKQYIESYGYSLKIDNNFIDFILLN